MEMIMAKHGHKNNVGVLQTFCEEFILLIRRVYERLIWECSGEGQAIAHFSIPWRIVTTNYIRASNITSRIMELSKYGCNYLNY